MEIVVNVRPYEGSYPLDFVDDMTRGEWRLIKRLTGYMPLTFFDGWRNADPDVSGVLAVVALLRAGKIGDGDVQAVWDRLSSASAYGSVEVEHDDDGQAEDDDAGPPETRPEENTSSSGEATSDSSETSPPNRPETGARNSDSSVSGLVTSRR